MQEKRWNGSEKLTPSAGLEDLVKAFEDEQNASVTMHKPGAEFDSKGKRFRVDEQGMIEEVKRAFRQQEQRQKRR